MANIIEVLKSTGGFSIFLKALKISGRAKVLTLPGPYTVLAPNDDAFEKLSAGVLDALLEDKENLIKILNCHILLGKNYKKDLLVRQRDKTFHGCSIRFKANDDSPTGLEIENSKVIKADIIADNGIIQIVDTVIIHRDIGKYRPVSV